MTIRYQTKNLAPWVDDSVLSAIAPQVSAASELLRSGKGPGSDFLGWYDPSKVVSSAELAAIKAAAKRIQEQSEILVTVGIGGSYLGARAVQEALPYEDTAEEGVDIDFAGHHISARDTEALLDSLDDVEVSVNVISKSGTTTEHLGLVSIRKVSKAVRWPSWIHWPMEWRSVVNSQPAGNRPVRFLPSDSPLSCFHHSTR